jgi:ATP-dependent DNA helicase RecQ
LSAHDLAELLHRVFGHRDFRAHQREVCEAAASGRDVLLVMPTGAGKSLCYQLPALARGGTGLVISPLIALMDDQAQKLTSLQLRVARIHSGLAREDARQACRDYLAGELDFLFIAPERMRVPGFPEMLAKRKPALVAIDEAHCISQWGHDFRPDYRTLGQYLPALRPAPIIALTATATPAVQSDIALQLDLQNPAVFITGFRRDNLAVEVVELSKPERAEFTAKLLQDASARPAIVYAGSRKDAEEMAAKLGKHFPTAAYHAGLDAGTRDRVQRAFLSGKLEVVVATVAFGMGVDKADVRTVVHVALPASVEAYYQEIGRAGRDGKPSRTVLLHGFADRRLQEFLLERNYPALTEVEKVAQVLPDDWTPLDRLHNAVIAKKQVMDRETLERAVEKLLVTGLAVMDIEGNVRYADDAAAARGWKSSYEGQIAARKAQIDHMVAFAESTKCRMRTLVEHFGDQSDTRASCGLCDVCYPHAGNANAAHQPDAQERQWLRSILRALENRPTATGKLFTDLALVKDRKAFDTLLDALARAGLLSLSNDTFTNAEGKEITYRKAAITFEGRNPDEATLDTVWIRGVASDAGTKKTARSKSSSPVKRSVVVEELNGDAAKRFERLKQWRTEQARPTRTPAFMILSDAVLRAIAAAAPGTIAELHTISGMGPAKVERFGAAVLAACRGEVAAAASPSTKKVPFAKGERREIERAPNTQPIKNRITVSNTKHVQPSPPAKSFTEIPLEFSAEQKELEARLRSWRSEQARAAGLPSFFILSDTALRGIVAAAPKSLGELRGVHGVGTEQLTKYGEAVLDLCRV